MEKTIDIIRKTRFNFLKLVNSLTIEQLNIIPADFNNNIAWNLGHLVCSQQKLCYQFADSNFRIPIESVLKYGKGTKPESLISDQEIITLSTWLVKNIDDLETDLKNGFFTTQTNYETSYGVVLSNIEDTVKFVSAHEGVHFGYAMALKRII